MPPAGGAKTTVEGNRNAAPPADPTTMGRFRVGLQPRGDAAHPCHVIQAATSTIWRLVVIQA